MQNGDKIKNLSATLNNGRKLSFIKYQGNKNLLLIFFRGAWCNHCKKQLFDINKRLNEFLALDYKILAISPENKFKSSVLKTFLKINFPIISDENLEIINYFKLKTKYRGKTAAKPAIFAISKNQRIQYYYIGKRYDDRLTAKSIISGLKLMRKNSAV